MAEVSHWFVMLPGQSGNDLVVVYAALCAEEQILLTRLRVVRTKACEQEELLLRQAYRDYSTEEITRAKCAWCDAVKAAMQAAEEVDKTPF